jgi:hypothetical protein
MTPNRNHLIAIALLAPGVLLPAALMLSRLDRPDVAFGLGTDFFAGLAFGVMFATSLVALARLARDASAKRM